MFTFSHEYLSIFLYTYNCNVPTEIFIFCVQGEEAEGGDEGERDTLQDQGRLESHCSILCQAHLIISGLYVCTFISILAPTWGKKIQRTSNGIS
jgi:hypothetical protein